ncbi:hypothetical protein B0H19DRAFT_1257402 [Mycena capillaripes]|nr:hypothetical protein B0H19DRAFT_1257402 [Mycena capillaripes]
MTVTQHTALYRFTDRPGTDQIVLLDVTGSAFLSSMYPLITFTSSPTAGGTMHATGSSAFIPSFRQEDHRVYFCFEALGPGPAGVSWCRRRSTRRASTHPSMCSRGNFGTYERRREYGIWKWRGDEKGQEDEVKGALTLGVRMGISWCRYAEEVPDMVAFDEVLAAARCVVFLPIHIARSFFLARY